jgi:hypothetical protein
VIFSANLWRPDFVYLMLAVFIIGQGQTEVVPHRKSLQTGTIDLNNRFCWFDSNPLHLLEQTRRGEAQLLELERSLSVLVG